MSSTQRLFMAGLVIMMLGIQLRIVDRFILNEKTTSILNRHIPTTSADHDLMVSFSSDLDSLTTSRRSVHPPEWLGWSLMSVGAVLVLTSPIFRT